MWAAPDFTGSCRRRYGKGRHSPGNTDIRKAGPVTDIKVFFLAAIFRKNQNRHLLRGQMRAPKVIPGRKTHQGQITNGMISMEAKAGRVMGIQTGDQR